MGAAGELVTFLKAYVTWIDTEFSIKCYTPVTPVTRYRYQYTKAETVDDHLARTA